MSWNSFLNIKSSQGGGKPLGSYISVVEKSVRIRIERKNLVAVGWMPGDRVMLGDEDDFGLIRIEKNEYGWILSVHSKTDPEKTQWVSVKIARATLRTAIPLPDRLSCSPIDLQVRDGGLEFSIPWMSEFRKAKSSEDLPVVEEKTIDPLEAVEAVVQDERIAPESSSKKLRGDFSYGNVRTRDNGRIHLPEPSLVSEGNQK
jgi:hypothetical protein